MFLSEHMYKQTYYTSVQVRATQRWDGDGQPRWRTNCAARKFTILSQSWAANSPRWPWQGDARLVLLDFCRLQRIIQIRSISQGMIVIWAQYLLQWNGGEGINKHIELLLGHLQVLSAFHITTNPRTYFISTHHHHERRERSDWPSGSWWWQCSRLLLNTSLKTDFILLWAKNS